MMKKHFTLTNIETVLKIVILALIIVHLPGWLKGTDHLLDNAQKASGSFKEAADTSNMSSTEVLNTIGTINHKVLPAVTGLLGNLATTATTLNKTAATLNATVETVNTTVGNVNDVLVDVRSQSQTTVDKLNAVLESTRKGLDQIPPTMQASRGTMNAATSFLNGPLAKNSESIDTVLHPVGLMFSDWQFKEHQFFFGKNCAINVQNCPKEKIGRWQRTLLIINAARGYTQPAYYGQRMVTGQ